MLIIKVKNYFKSLIINYINNCYDTYCNIWINRHIILSKERLIILKKLFLNYTMPKFKSTQDIIRIIGNKDQIRNFGVIAHVDHGKTTMSDSLLAASGIISPTVAGQALALDSMKLEQNRQMTIRGANVTLFYENEEGKEYVINMIDTPGHIDFTGRVTRALRAIDGVVVVSDSVEGIMTQTETVTRQALEERVRPVLYINKIDRLVKELRLDPAAMQKWLSNIIAEFNRFVDLYAEPELKEKWKVSIQGNTVAFGSAKDRWGFNFNVAQKKGNKLQRCL